MPGVKDENRRPKIGEVVHFVVRNDDEEMGVKRGQHLPLLVVLVKDHPLWQGTFEVTGSVFFPLATGGTCVWNDQERKLTGTWHYDDGCCDGEANRWATDNEDEEEVEA